MQPHIRTSTLGGLDPGLADRCHREIQRLLRLRGSTTFFLEDLACREVYVTVVAQSPRAGGGTIRRESVLHLDGRSTPILFSTCALDGERITSRELAAVRGGIVPLGKIFDPDNRGRLVKAHREIRHGDDPAVALHLRTRSTFCYSRRYDLEIEGQQVGTITESLNEESLARLWEGES